MSVLESLDAEPEGDIWADFFLPSSQSPCFEQRSFRDQGNKDDSYGVSSNLRYKFQRHQHLGERHGWNIWKKHQEKYYLLIWNFIYIPISFSLFIFTDKNGTTSVAIFPLAWVHVVLESAGIKSTRCKAVNSKAIFQVIFVFAFVNIASDISKYTRTVIFVILKATFITILVRIKITGSDIWFSQSWRIKSDKLPSYSSPSMDLYFPMPFLRSFAYWPLNKFHT